MDNNDSAYTNEEYQDIWENIKQLYIGNVEISEKPKLVFAAGQPASGKSVLPSKIQQDYPESDFVVIDMDAYRKFHPHIKRIENTPEQYVQFTNPFSIRVERDMLEDCIANKRNFIHVGTMRIYEYLYKVVIEEAIRQGYEIEVYALAVPTDESKKSALMRVKEQRERGEKFVRITDPTFIEEADKGFMNSMKIMSESDDISNIRIFKRGQSKDKAPVLVYDDEKDKGIKYRNGYEALLVTRDMEKKRLEEIREEDEGR